MPIPAGMARIVLYGDMPNGEIFETGFWMSGTVVENAAQANALALVIGAELSAMDSSGAMRVTMGLICSGQTVWRGVRVYAYPTGGTVATYVGDYLLPTPVAGSQSTHLPNQVALVLTLRTGLSGRRNRGRMYLPLTAYSFPVDAQMVQSDLATLTNSWALAFTDINASSTGKIVVVSQVGTTDNQVLSVTMDSRADIQRRRANREAILRTSVGAVTP